MQSRRRLRGTAELERARPFITVLRDAPDFIARLSDAELWDAIERFRAIGAEDEGGATPVRESEYATILAAEVEKLDPNYKNESDEDFHAIKPAPGTAELPDGVSELVLIERLREVRVLTGFTRLEPPTQNIYGEFDLHRTRAAPSLSLGGLVDQGRRLAHHLHAALRRAKLCSHDPVCGRSQPDDGRPGRALLGAACHGCLFIAECSCERANQYLDRALVVPTLGIEDGESLAFFASPAL